jgi:hypothetical protein
MNTLTRRGVLGAATIGAGALALGPLAGLADAAVASGTGVVGAGVDVSHATPELVKLLDGYFAAKTRRDLAATMAYFDRRKITYGDTTLGYLWSDWASLDAAYAQVISTWPATAHSYPNRILGDMTSAVVLFTNNPVMYGGEIQAMGTLDLRGGKVQRWVDHWDSRHFGSALAARLRVPAARFPAEFGESTVGEHASPVMRKVVAALSRAFAHGDADQAASLFADGAAFEDLTLHATFFGPLGIAAFLHRALLHLPYGGTGVAIRHTVGSTHGGGYEWKAAAATVRNGAIALELDSHGQITRFTAAWDGSLLSNAALQAILALTIEQ